MGPNGSETKYKLKKKLYNYLITQGTGTIPESHFRLSGIYSNGYFFFHMGETFRTMWVLQDTGKCKHAKESTNGRHCLKENTGVPTSLFCEHITMKYQKWSQKDKY